ncbi:hypothetical protein BWD12_01625 [Leptospira santarosai serovar Bananal]|nr:hypothetical protein BWD11_16670 [Leptospira santarosai serovar Grippotyphosa]ONF81619.1 hypothetical protein BWD12_01625 [Leptospira santarosai serovar Bananal]
MRFYRSAYSIIEFLKEAYINLEYYGIIVYFDSVNFKSWIFSKILTWKKVVNYERLFPILIFEGRRNLDLLLYGDFVEKGK